LLLRKKLCPSCNLNRRSISAWQPQEPRRTRISKSKVFLRNKNSAPAPPLQTKIDSGGVFN